MLERQISEATEVVPSPAEPVEAKQDRELISYHTAPTSNEDTNTKIDEFEF